MSPFGSPDVAATPAPQKDRIVTPRDMLVSKLSGSEVLRIGYLKVSDWSGKNEPLPKKVGLLVDFMGFLGYDGDNSRMLGNRELGTLNSVLCQLQRRRDTPLYEWTDLETEPNNPKVVVEETLKRMQESASKASKPLSSEDLDVCVASALACGNPAAAAKFIENAGLFTNSMTGELMSKEKAISRYTSISNVFERAKLIYPPDAKGRFQKAEEILEPPPRI